MDGFRSITRPLRRERGGRSFRLRSIAVIFLSGTQGESFNPQVCGSRSQGASILRRGHETIFLPPWHPGSLHDYVRSGYLCNKRVHLKLTFSDSSRFISIPVDRKSVV